MNTYFHPLINNEHSLPFFVNCIGGLKNQGHIIRNSGYPDYQWIHCIKGKGILLVDGKEFFITKNSGFLLYPLIPHEYFAVEEPWETHFVAFTGYGIPDLMNLLEFSPYGIYTFNDLKHLDDLITDLFKKLKANTFTSCLRSSAQLYNLIIELRNSILENDIDSLNTRFKRVQPVIDFIEASYKNNPSIEEMADVINVSPQYLCRLFKETHNISPFTYLTRFRLQTAKKILRENAGIKVGEVASLVGYNDESYFCSIFKRYEGITPLVFKNMNKFYD